MGLRKWIFVGLAMVLAGCVAQKPVVKGGAPTPTPPIAAGPSRELIVFIPQSDAAAASWFKLLEKYPHLRMVIAVSPRFKRFSKEPMLKLQALSLQNSKRLELALQLPNSPFLPLLINSDSAKTAVPAGSSLPSPPFAYPDDATQIIARSKSDFRQIFALSPKGMVLPHGAASRDLLNLANRLDLSWVIAALGAPSISGAYKVGSLLVFDATPSSVGEALAVQVWDERVSGDPVKSLHTLETWAKEMDAKGVQAILPSDPGLPTQELTDKVPWMERTWTTTDWSPWIGSGRKNAAWAWLRKTRADLEAFQNSGRASVSRLDLAFEEMYTAENSNYFLSISNDSSDVSEEHERDFKATLGGVYRMMNQTPPDNLFSQEAPSPPLSSTDNGKGSKGEGTTSSWESLPDGRQHLTFLDPMGDDHGGGSLTYPSGAAPGTYDLRSLEVWASSDTLDWAVTLGAPFPSSAAGPPVPLIDIYMDLNGVTNVGTIPLLPGRVLSAAPSDAWEYALTLWGAKAQLYRTRDNGSYDFVDAFPVTIQGNTAHVQIPRQWLRGNPQHWGYQVLVMAYDPHSPENDPRPLIPASKQATPLPVYDLLDPDDTTQSQLLSEVEQGLRSGIPFVHVRSNR